MKPVIELPFKPFTLDEVKAITGCPANLLDRLVTSPVSADPKAHLMMTMGSGTMGLDFMQTFAAFVCWRYLQEGASHDRAMAVLDFVKCMTLDYLRTNFAMGLTFPVPKRLMSDQDQRLMRGGAGVMVKAPDGRLGAELNLAVLYARFEAEVTRVFPPKNHPAPT